MQKRGSATKKMEYTLMNDGRGRLGSRGGSARLIVGIVLGVAWIGGCGPTRKYEPAVAPESLNDMQFVHYLGTVPVVTFSEGCRAILIAADGEDTFDTHEARYAELRQRGIVRDAWGVAPEQVLDWGTLAFMAAEVCKLPPSVNSVLLGSWGLGDRRYAIKRAVDYGILEYGPPYKMVTGGEMLLALQHMDAYLAGDRETAGHERWPSLDARYSCFVNPQLMGVLLLLPATSPAVEGGFRRHGKMQKTVYRVRTPAQVSRRAQPIARRATGTSLASTWARYHSPSSSASVRCHRAASSSWPARGSAACQAL